MKEDEWAGLPSFVRSSLYRRVQDATFPLLSHTCAESRAYEATRKKSLLATSLYSYSSFPNKLKTKHITL